MRFPNYIMIQTVSGCNASCKFCPYPYIREQIPFHKMNNDTFRKIIDECSHHKNIKVIMPYLMNEPLLDRNLPEKIAYIKTKVPWAKVHILTNGSLLDKEFAHSLIKSGIDWIGFSFHGIYPQTIEEVMGIDFHSTLTNILNFIEISKSSKKDLSQFIMITFLQHDRLSPQEKEETFKFWKEKGITRISFYTSPISRAGNVPVLPKVRNEKIYNCNSLWTDEMIHILCDGTVVLCCMDWKREVVLGNVNKNSIEEIWNSELFQKTWKQIKGEIPPFKNLICLRCECARIRPDILDNKILLIMPPPWIIETPPLDLGIMSEILEESGYEVEILDLNILLYTQVDPEDKSYWQMDNFLYWENTDFLNHIKHKYSDLFQKIEKKLKNDTSKIVIISIPTNCMYLMAEWIVNLLKEQYPERFIITEGIPLTIEEQRKELISKVKDKIDVIVLGETKAIIKNLVDNIFKDKSIIDIPNTVILRGGNQISGKITSRGINFDNYPFPKFRKFPLHLYEKKYGIDLPPVHTDIYWHIRPEIPYTSKATASSQDRRKKKIKKNKKINVILATVPPWGINNPPVGLAYLASYLRKYGYQPRVFDFNIEFYYYGGEELRHLWHVENKNFWKDKDWFKLVKDIFDKKIDECVKKILETPARIIGFSTVDPKENLTIEFIRRIKEKDKKRKIILGGPACLTAHSRKIFVDEVGSYIDYFVPGEGEETLLDIVKNNCQGDIPGTIFSKNGSWKFIPRPEIKDLNQIPFPTYEDFDLNLYPGNSLILEWSRGCMGKCAFCINYKFVKGYRCRSAEHIFEELKYHVNVNNIRQFTICDPIINGNLKVLDKLCDLIIKSGMKILWTGEAIPRKDMTSKLLAKMKKAGCYKLQIGVESGSHKVLQNMRKLYTPQVAEEFLRNAYRAGMETEIFIMIGFPGEGEKEFQETVEFVKRNSDYIDTIKSINTLHLIAGADVYEHRKKFGIKPLPPENWHYLWETEDGNNYEIRRRRGEYLLEVARKLGIKVMETNLHEGKHLKQKEIDYQKLKLLVNNLQKLPEKRKFSLILPRRRLVKLPYLTLILLLTLMAEVYLWILKKLRRMVIFPGS